MGDLSHWDALSRFTVDETAFLIEGVDPASVKSIIKFRKEHELYPKCFARKKALVAAILSSELLAEIHFGKQVYDRAWWDCYVELDGGIPDWTQTTIDRKDIQVWLNKKLIPSGYFSISGKPGYLDPYHPQYAHKLAAVVTAWLEVNEIADKKEKTPKQLLEEWLKQHAGDYEGLAHKNGTPQTSTIEECAKVANWDPEGGRRKKMQRKPGST